MKSFQHIQKMPWYYGIDDYYIWKTTDGMPLTAESAAKRTPVPGEAGQ